MFRGTVRESDEVMLRKARLLAAAAMALVAVCSQVHPASAAGSTVSSSITTKWKTNPVLKLVVTPNYYTGYGAILSKFGGTASTPVAGPAAPAAVDFGSVLAGDSYLYKYAAHVSVTTNDASGFYLYAEGTADFINTSGGYAPLSNTLYWVPSVASGADSNNGFNNAAYPFYKTSGTVSGSPPFIDYAGVYPTPTESSAAMSADYYYDYLLKVPATANAAAYSIYIVYTVVPR